jgi:hypothetical protein
VVEPSSDIEGQAPPFEVVQHRTAQAFAEPFGSLAGAIFVEQIVFGESLKCGTQDPHPVCSRCEPNRTVGRRREPVPEGGLNEVCGEQLANSFERIHRFLNRFRGTSIHQVGVDQNAGFSEGRCHEGSLIHGDAFLDFVQQSVGRCFESGADRDTAGGSQKATQVRRERFFESDIAPP